FGRSDYENVNGWQGDPPGGEISWMFHWPVTSGATDLADANTLPICPRNPRQGGLRKTSRRTKPAKNSTFVPRLSARWRKGGSHMTAPDIQARQIRQLARYQVRPEGLEKSLAAIRKFVAYLSTNEPGTPVRGVARGEGPNPICAHLRVPRRGSGANP